MTWQNCFTLLSTEYPSSNYYNKDSDLTSLSRHMFRDNRFILAQAWENHQKQAEVSDQCQSTRQLQVASD